MGTISKKSKTLLTLNMNINLEETKHFLIEMSFFFIRERTSNAVIVGPKLEVDHLKK